ncbi:C6 transcription factor [Colletotrichum plurivorum]|uniref:C6 transcription factor n=1 Tax=Colletotrichum plurivorum TaxID=2175906 RepID=A0A8H6J400_9PEZI|nr:C6 transcription factor [Colletotrichum plurivorum]
MGEGSTSSRSPGTDGLPTPGGSERRRPAVHRRGLKRSSAACQRCRKRKQKCDGKLPVCGPCDVAQATCIPSERLVIRPEIDCQCAALRERVSELENENNLIRVQLSAVPRQLDGSITTTTTTASASASAQTQRPVGLVTSRILLPTFPRLEPTEADQVSFLSSPWRLWDGLAATETPQTTDDAITTLLSEEGRLELVDIFFVRRWPQYPVLHRPTFMQKHYLPVTSRGDSASEFSTFIVHMVLAIGASEKNRSSPSRQAVHQSYFRSAIRKLNHALTADDLDAIQCLFLLSMYGSYEPQAIDLWHTTGLALRLAVGINLHRRESLGRQGLLEDEMAKRLFWCIYTMDRSICITMGRPLGIQDSDITMPLPLCLTDETLISQQGDPSLPLSALASDPGDMSTFLHIIQLRRLNADIYKAIHSAGDTALTADSVDVLRSQYYAQLNQWLVSAPRYISPACMNQTSEWFQIAYHQAVMNLYKPSHASPPGSVSLDAIRLCADSAISLIINYSSLHAKNRITYSFVALTSLFMAAVTMLYSLRASSVLRAELTQEVVESNIGICCKLLRSMSNGRTVGERSAAILQRLGAATTAIFSAEVVVEGGIDTEFMSWFGLKSQHSELDQTTPSVDMPWNDLFDNGFDYRGLFCNDMLL